MRPGGLAALCMALAFAGIVIMVANDLGRGETLGNVFAVIMTVGMAVNVQRLANPRIEMEEHYYNATHSRLLDLGLRPHLLSVAYRLTGTVADAAGRERADRVSIQSHVPGAPFVLPWMTGRMVAPGCEQSMCEP